MGIQFILGRSGTGKTARILEEIKSQVKERPIGDPVIYLVPEQMTFLSEYDLAADPALGGVMRAQVYSFTRLAWRVLQETGGMSRKHISAAGLNILIRKIIEDQKEELTIFSKAADKSGFVSHVEAMLTEFKRYCVTPETLSETREAVQQQKGSKALADKLHDLQMIYSEFEKSLMGKYLDSEDYLRLLAEAVASSEYLQTANIYIDGFHSFTPQEYEVIGQLMKHAKRVTIALTVDQAFRTRLPEDTHLFRQTGETYVTLYELAKHSGVSIEEDQILEASRRYQERSLIHLEQYFEHRPVVPYQNATSLSFLEAANRRAEIEGIAREIRKLSREEGYRYKQMAILVRNGHEYQQLIETVFHDYNLPFYIDKKNPMIHHPVIELIRATLEIVASNWRYEPVFRAVKTDLLFPLKGNWNKLREQMDRLENYVLAYGIRGDRWTKEEQWSYRRYRGLEGINRVQTDEEQRIEREINELKRLISKPISRLARRLKQAKTSRAFCEAIYLYLEELEIPRKLETLSMDAQDRGDLITAREHSQAWSAVIELLDQYVEVLGEETMTVKKFAATIDAGLETLKFSNVPAAADQVMVANLELSRLANIDVAFIVGVNDGVLPGTVKEEGVLADDDRELLLSRGIKLAQSSKTRLLDEEFIAYKAFTTPSSRLYISYPIADEEGKALQPSLFIKRLKEMFPSAEERVLVNEPSDLSEEEGLHYVCHPNPTLSYLTTQLQLKRLGYPMYDYWWDVYNFYLDTPEQKEKVSTVLSSLFYKNKTEVLDEQVSKSLYGEEILASVSRMELFNSCPFSHFVNHGLKLREREMYRLQAPDIGDLFHGALKWIAEEIEKRGLYWGKLTKEQCLQLAKEAVVHLGPQLQNQILLSSNRHLYISRKLEQIIGRASYILSGQAKVSGFAPVGIELGFGPQAELPPLSFTLKNGTKMALAGRIDRVDQARNNEEVYLRIIDYKSSGRDLDMTEVYYGFALQMLTYLDIVLTYSQQLVGEKAHPAGVLYFHVHNPMVNSKKVMTIEQIEEEIFKSFKMKGLVLAEEEVVRLMDTSLEGGNSKIISAGINKSNGKLAKSSKVAHRQQFDDMRQHVRNIYQQSGDDIVAGKVDIAPYQYKKRTPCDFCSYRPVCQFDEMMEENHYRTIVPYKKEEIFQKMSEKRDERD
ncbi:helicase-exonuclease AddAB subunit AddB [Bacillus sp. REN10]|uniref:helicase-exonuclease AddAB subunit AddB n=1 Tax=Bacillus sp. REN10 TaxID=2782541 RepID=UPI00193C5BF0|nr:helicase-exonuclease AddAB subunit AddB [Bacillus sp. REN10]